MVLDIVLMFMFCLLLVDIVALNARVRKLEVGPKQPNALTSPIHLDCGGEWTKWTKSRWGNDEDILAMMDAKSFNSLKRRCKQCGYEQQRRMLLS